MEKRDSTTLSPALRESFSVEIRERRKRKTQQCIYCQNHGEDIVKKEHVCPFRDCECLLCDLLRKAQKTMREQQRIWRDQKNNLKLIYGTNFNFNSISGQVCDMCRNHLKLVYKKQHECPLINCSCDYCNVTRRRREMMKQLQRVRRCKITTEINDEEDMLESNIHDEDVDEDSNYRSSAGEFSYKSENVEYVYDESGVLFPKTMESLIETDFKDNSEFIRTKNCSPPPLIPLESYHFESISSKQEEFSGSLPVHNQNRFPTNSSPPPLCLIDNINEIEMKASAEEDGNMEDLLTAVNRFTKKKRLLGEQANFKQEEKYCKALPYSHSSSNNINNSKIFYIKEEPTDEPVYLPYHRESYTIKHEMLKNHMFY